MPASWVDVANSALIKIGVPIISGFNDLNKAEKLTKARYRQARNIVLRLHVWNCAMKRDETAPLASPVPAFGYEYFHAWPSDCLRIVDVGPEGVEFRVEGRRIATDETLLELRYIREEDDPTLIDELCAECIALYLAWDLCEAFQQTSEKKDMLWKDFQKMLPQAKSVDGKEEAAQEIQADEWMESRLFNAGSALNRGS